jgi:phospho-N-acetylmuramoyl-pentapeptide-transferase
MDNIIYAVLVSFSIALAAGYVGIPLLKRLKLGQQVRDDGPKTHLSKAGTPTMGGLIMWAGLIVATLAFSRADFQFVWLALSATIGFGLIGLMDDLIIVLRKRSLGLKAYQKIIGQVGIALIVAFFAYKNVGSELIIPFGKGLTWDLGGWYVPFTVFVIVAMVNGVNLTDGLDGLAGGVTMINALTYTIILYICYQEQFSQGNTYEAIGTHNMMIFSAALMGACLAFLRFNAYPAKIFMGDTGSLALGAALSVIGIVARLQILLAVTGIMYVASTVSVILQVGSYKLRKKRIFKMAPLHHHFELKGIPETKIVATYMVITTVFCLIAILSVPH